MIVLASASPRRTELLSSLTSNFIAEAADVEEVTCSEHPADIVMDLAALKAAAVAANHVGDTVIGADTLVWHGGRALGKPKIDKTQSTLLRSCAAECTAYLRASV